MAVKFGARDVDRLETVYAAPAIVAQRGRTRAAVGARSGERGLDVGCGPAFLACELGREVGPAGRVIGVDESPEMLEAARARIAREGLTDRVEVRQGEAGRLDFPSGLFDFVTGVQVYLYVADVAGALAEAARVLRPGGRLAVVDTDWDSCVWLTTDRDRHRRVMEARLGHFVQRHLPPRLPGLLDRAGLRLVHAEAIPVLELTGGPGTFSGGLIEPTANLAIRYGIARDDAEAWKADLLARVSGGEYFFSLTRYLFVATRPGD
jgi:ubiquinone/menaquinone biosynthesis C-methylase UbiE